MTFDEALAATDGQAVAGHIIVHAAGANVLIGSTVGGKFNLSDEGEAYIGRLGYSNTPPVPAPVLPPTVLPPVVKAAGAVDPAAELEKLLG